MGAPDLFTSPLVSTRMLLLFRIAAFIYQAIGKRHCFLTTLTCPHLFLHSDFMFFALFSLPSTLPYPPRTGSFYIAGTTSKGIFVTFSWLTDIFNTLYFVAILGLTYKHLAIYKQARDYKYELLERTPLTWGMRWTVIAGECLCTAALVVTITYWTFLAGSSESSMSFKSVHMHITNLIIMMGELFLSRLPFFVTHVFCIIVMGILYIGTMLIYYGVSRGFVYELFDWYEHPIQGIIFWPLILVVAVIFFFVNMGLATLRDYIGKKCAGDRDPVVDRDHLVFATNNTTLTLPMSSAAVMPAQSDDSLTRPITNGGGAQDTVVRIHYDGTAPANPNSAVGVVHDGRDRQTSVSLSSQHRPSHSVSRLNGLNGAGMILAQAEDGSRPNSLRPSDAPIAGGVHPASFTEQGYLIGSTPRDYSNF